MTTINLSKGAPINLSKADPTLKIVHVGLQWDARQTDGSDYDLDASAILTDGNSKVINPEKENFVFYNMTATPSGSVVHTGDNRTGDGDGDDEVIVVDLTKVAPEVQEIHFVVSIHDEHNTGQTFGQVRNSLIRILDKEHGDNAEPLAIFELDEDAHDKKSVIFGKLYRRGSDWSFRALGEGYTNGLAGVLSGYGISAS